VADVRRCSAPACVRLLCFAVISAIGLALVAPAAAGAVAGRVHMIALPDPTIAAGGVTRGPGYSMWFTDGGAILRISHAGRLAVHPLHDGWDADPSIVMGPDGALWFPEYNVTGAPVGAIGRMSPGGDLADFPLPGKVFAHQIAAGPDGNLWFTASGGRIGRISTVGSLVLFDLPPREYAIAITGGPDGNVWFTEGRPDRIGTITPAGVVTEFGVPHACCSDYFESITAGADGNVWFTNDHGRGWIAAMRPDGTFLGRWIPKDGLHPTAITAASDGDLWYLAADGELAGRFTPGGKFAYFPIDIPSIYRHNRMAFGHDGRLWFPDGQYGTFVIVRMGVS